MASKVFLAAIGCKLNTNEKELMGSALRDLGFEIIDDDSSADYIILNSCTVTGRSDSRTRKYLRAARKKNSRCVIIVTGCSAQRTGADLSLIEDVDYIRGNLEKDTIPQLLMAIENGESPPRCVVSDMTSPGQLNVPVLRDFKTLTRPFIKIQDGCNNGCAYCAIPLARGPQRSSPPDTVLKQVEIFAQQGFAEIVLSGVHLGGYGEDLDEEINLARLLFKMLQIKACPRIRISSLEPPQFTDELFELLVKHMNNGRICRHLHIPLQHGSDTTLKRMGRRYNSSFYENLIHTLVSRVPHISIGSDILVGFPGTTDNEFNECRAFVENLPLSYFHVFAYSIRPDTSAATMSGHIDAKVKKERSRIIREISATKRSAYLQSQIGVTLEGVVIQPVKNHETTMEVLSDNYIKLIVKNWPQHIVPGSVVTIVPRTILGGNVMEGTLYSQNS